MRLLIAAAILLLISCAQVGSITGGPQDTTPPVVLNMFPANKTLNFNYKYITIDFDEYIQLKNVNKELIISPSMEVLPTISLKGKSVIIDFTKTNLAENTTYILNFGNAIVDNNESNKLENFQYVFSTGNFIDSLTVSGKIIASKNQKELSNVSILLYKNLSDTVVYKNKPYYYTKTDAKGLFLFNNIKPGTYQIIALKDENNNLLFDKSEAIAFLNKPITINKNLDSLTLNLFIEKDTLQFIKPERSTNFGSYKFTLKLPSDSILITPTNAPISYFEKNKTNDSLVFWFKNLTESTSILISDFTNNFHDTLHINPVTEKENSKKTLLTYSTNIISNKLELNANPTLSFLTPILNIDTTKIHLLKDSIPVKFKTFFLNETHKKISLLASFKELNNYKLIIDSNAFSDINKTYHLKRDTIDFSLKPATDYGNLNLKIEIPKPTKNYIFQLKNSINQTYNEVVLKADTTLHLTLLNPGNYNIVLIEDANNNGKWDTGNFLLKQQPETIHYYPSQQTIRANWDLELDWKLR